MIISWMVTLSSCLIWQISFILLSNEYGCVHAWTTLGNIATDRLTEDADLGKKKIIFSDEVHFYLGEYVNKQNCRIWGTENPLAYIEKPMHPKRVTVWCGFWSRGIIGPFFFENEQGEAVTANGDRYRAMLNKFLLTKIKEENIGNIGFNRTTLRATQPKLHSILCALFLKIVLSATELILFKGQYSGSHWWNTAAHNR